MSGTTCDWLQVYTLLTGDLSLEGAVASSVLILSPDHAMVVDTGFHRPAITAAVVEALNERGLSPEDIDAIVNTHLHADHYANNMLFKNAQVFVHRRELEWCKAFNVTLKRAADLAEAECIIRHHFPLLSDEMVHSFAPEAVEWARQWSLDMVARSGTLMAIEGSESILPGVHILETPGHSPGHIAVLVTGEEHSILIAGDALALAREYKTDIEPPFPPMDEEKFWQSRRQIDEMNVSIIVPGHDAPLEVTGGQTCPCGGDLQLQAWHLRQIASKRIGSEDGALGKVADHRSSESFF